MDQAGERALAHLIAQDGDGIVIGVAGVDDHAATRPCAPPRYGRGNWPAGGRAANVRNNSPGPSRRCHDLGMRRLRAQQCGFALEQLLFGFMRMHADAAPHIGKSLRHRAHAGKALQLGADADTDAHAGGTGALHHRVQLPGKIGKVEMAMTVDEHHSAPPARRASEISRRRSAPSGAVPDSVPRRGRNPAQSLAQRHPALQPCRAGMRPVANARRQGLHQKIAEQFQPVLDANDLVAQRQQRQEIWTRCLVDQTVGFACQGAALAGGKLQRRADAAAGKPRQRRAFSRARFRQIVPPEPFPARRRPAAASPAAGSASGWWAASRPGVLDSSSSMARPGGSSSILSSALAALSFMSSAVSTMATRQPPAPDVMPKKSASLRISSTDSTVISLPVLGLMAALEHQQAGMRAGRHLVRHWIVWRNRQIFGSRVASRHRPADSARCDRPASPCRCPAGR